MTFEKRLFETKLAARAEEFDQRLATLLDRTTPGMAGVPARLGDAMRHAVTGGGKRIRPFLVVETAGVLGCNVEDAMPAALALELIHCYSLVHDDLPVMDNDELRRGKPTVWKAFDDWTALLAGDALLTMAFEVMASEHKAGSPALVALLAKAAGARGMVGGQCLDLEADKLGQPQALSAEHILRLQAMKTGALFRFACEAGAILGGADAATKGALTRFGEKLGAAFQLADDLLDVEGDAATVGKATGKDAAAGKATLIALMGLDAGRARLADLAEQALSDIADLGPRADVLRETLHFACARKK